MAKWVKDRKLKTLICSKCGKKDIVNKSCQIRLCQDCDYIQMIPLKKNQNGVNKTL